MPCAREGVRGSEKVYLKGEKEVPRLGKKCTLREGKSDYHGWGKGSSMWQGGKYHGQDKSHGRVVGGVP